MPKRTKDLEEAFSVGNSGIINTTKVLRIESNIAVVDSNNIQLPCVAEYRGKRITAFEYVWKGKESVIKEGKEIKVTVKRGVLISGHGEYGIPTLRDIDVLITLQDLFIRRKTKDGVCELKIEGITEEDLIIDFSINKLARELGYAMPVNNTVRNNIKKSIEILVATTLVNRYSGGIYDITSKKYIKNLNAQYHYFESCIGYEEVELGDDVVETAEYEAKILDVTKIKISRFFYDMIVNNYKLFYDRAIYRKTKNYTARKIYLLALQWMGKKSYSTAMIDTLVERIPMAQKQTKYKRQYIKTALSNLHDNNILNIVYDDKVPNKVYMCKPGFSIDTNEMYFLSKFNTYDEVVDGLMEFDLLAIEIPLMFNVENIKYFQALLRYGNTLNSYGKIDNKRKWIAKGIEEKYNIDEKYYNKEEGQ